MKNLISNHGDGALVPKALGVAAMAGAIAAGLGTLIAIGAAAGTLAAFEAARGLRVRSLRPRASQRGHSGTVQATDA